VLCAMTERPILLIAGAEGVGKTAVAASKGLLRCTLT